VKRALKALNKSEMNKNKYIIFRLAFNIQSIPKMLLLCSFFLLVPEIASGEKSLNIGTQLLPPTRGNPHQNISLPGTLPLQSIFDSLTSIGANGEVKPALATSWSMESPTTWIINLRKDINFSNNEHFDASAVERAINFLLSENGKRETIGTHLSRIGVKSARAINQYAIEITTSRPNVILPLHLELVRIPAPQHFESLGSKEFSSNPIGSGPYKVRDWRENQVVLVSNKKSWRRPKINLIKILQVTDQAARLQGILSNSLDIALNISPDDSEAIKSANARLISYPNPIVSYIQFINSYDTPLNNLDVRKALNYAINKKKIIRFMFGDVVTPSSQITHNQAFGFNSQLNHYPYNPELANKLLKLSGYENGFSFATALINGDNKNDQAFQLIAADLSKVGVEMEIKRTTLAKYLEYIYQTGWPNSFQAFSMFTSGYDPMHGFRTRSCRWKPTYYCDKEITPLINKAENSKSYKDRLKNVMAVLAFENENPPGIFMWQNVSFDAVSNNIRGYSVEADVLQYHQLDTFKNYDK